MPEIVWVCEECGLRKQGGLRPPMGWCELSYWNGERFVRFAFCSYACCGKWCGKRYEEPKEDNG